MSCSSSRRYVRESSPPGSFSSPLSLSLFLSVIGSHLQTVGVRTQQKTARKHPWTADVGSKKASHVLSSPLAFICQRGSYQHLGPISWITVWKLWRGGRGCQLEGTTTDALGTFHKCETVGCQVYTLGIFVSVVPVFRFVFFLIFGQKRKNVQESAETEAVWEIHIFKKKTHDEYKMKWNNQEWWKRRRRWTLARHLKQVGFVDWGSRSRAPFNNAHTICTKENHTSQTRSEKKENPSERRL